MDMMKSYLLWPLLIQYIFIYYTAIFFVCWKLKVDELLFWVTTTIYLCGFFCFRCFLCSSSIHLSIYIFVYWYAALWNKLSIHRSREKKNLRGFLFGSWDIVSSNHHQTTNQPTIHSISFKRSKKIERKGEFLVHQPTNECRKKTLSKVFVLQFLFPIGTFFFVYSIQFNSIVSFIVVDDVVQSIKREETLFCCRRRRHLYHHQGMSWRCFVVVVVLFKFWMDYNGECFFFVWLNIEGLTTMDLK